jgi:hypothetical protein
LLVAELRVLGLNVPELVTVLGLPVALVAAVLAAMQLKAAREAANTAGEKADGAKASADAARAAVERTEKHLADNHLLLWIPRLEQVARSLELAAVANRRDAAMVHLTEWRETATHVRALVTRDGDRPDLVEKLQTAVALIISAKDDLVADKESTAAEATRHVRSAINEACDRASEIVAERMTRTRGNG